MRRRLAGLLAGLACVGVLGAQAPDDPTRLEEWRATERLRALQAEADRLAAEARTVVGELRRLEVDRQIALQELARAEAAARRLAADRDETAARLEALEAERLRATPGVEARLVEIYKRGRGGYLRLLLGADDLRAFGRLTRGVAAVARLDQVRLDAHRRTLQRLRDTLADLDARQVEADQAREAAAAARTAVERAVAARTRRIEAIDRERDLAAQYAGELREAQAELRRTLDRLAAGGRAAPAAPLPLTAFRGELDWPVPGRIVTRFGPTPSGRQGPAIVRNGIEIEAAEGTLARVVHGGTVSFAAPFTGYGTLVIVDHGRGAFTSYGHLASTDLADGTRVERGDTVGPVGLTPAGGPALYFEVRIDGRPVNPVQWLRSAQ